MSKNTESVGPSDARKTDAGGGKVVIGSNVKVAAAGTLLDAPLGHTGDSWSFPHFDTITVSVAGAPRPDEILVVMSIADGGRLRNRCQLTADRFRSPPCRYHGFRRPNRQGALTSREQ
jgi:hypothetical protein